MADNMLTWYLRPLFETLYDPTAMFPVVENLLLVSEQMLEHYWRNIQGLWDKTQ